MDRVVFDGTRAIGVEHSGGSLLRARREVILSAGTIGSPYLLLRSGVGAAEELRDAGIRPRARLAAGRAEKPAGPSLVRGVHPCKQPVALTGAESLGNLLRYLVLRSGMLTTQRGRGRRLPADLFRPRSRRADIELIFAPGPFIDHGLTPPTGHGRTRRVRLRPEIRAGSG